MNLSQLQNRWAANIRTKCGPWYPDGFMIVKFSDVPPCLAHINFIDFLTDTFVCVLCCARSESERRNCWLVSFLKVFDKNSVDWRINPDVSSPVPIECSGFPRNRQVTPIFPSLTEANKTQIWLNWVAHLILLWSNLGEKTHKRIIIIVIHNFLYHISHF